MLEQIDVSSKVYNDSGATEREVTFKVKETEFVVTENINGSVRVFGRYEGDTLPRCQVFPDTKMMDYTEEERAEYE